MAAARSWTAAAHNIAAWGSYRNGWDRMVKAVAAGRDAAAAGGEAVGKDDRINGTARKNAADALMAAVRAQRHARASFKDAVAHARTSASERALAAKAYASAGDADNERAARKRAEQARRLARDAKRWAATARNDARAALQASRWWAGEDTPGRSDGAVWPGGRAAWIDEQASMHADAEYKRAEWADMAEAAEAAVHAAGDDLHQCADATKRAAIAVDGLGPLPPEAGEAEAAWAKAVSYANRVAGECRPGVRPGSGSRRSSRGRGRGRRGAAERTA